MQPVVMTNIAIEHGHRNSEFSHENNVMFHSLPEGITKTISGGHDS